jgi:DNA-binding transcriptional MerR regulator
VRISEIARQLGVSADWLRQLERLGRIPRAPRDVNGHRRFRADDVGRLRDLLYPAPPNVSGETESK